MYTKTKIAICVAIAVSAASAGFAKDQNSRRDQVRAAQKTDQLRSFGQANGRGQGNCWVPTRDQNDESDADTRGLGYWGSCSEKGAVPSK